MATSKEDSLDCSLGGWIGVYLLKWRIQKEGWICLRVEGWKADVVLRCLWDTWVVMSMILVSWGCSNLAPQLGAYTTEMCGLTVLAAVSQGQSTSRFDSFQGLCGGTCPMPLWASGSLLAILHIPWLVNTSPWLPRLSLCMSASMSKFPFFIRTPIWLEQGPALMTSSSSSAKVTFTGPGG